MLKFLIPLIAFALFSCKNDSLKKHKNQIDLYRFAQVDILVNLDYYEMKIGDKLPIYYRTNTCCKFCIPKLNELPHLKFNRHQVIYDCPLGTAGANVTSSLNFIAVSKGIVTLNHGIIHPLENCDSTQRNLKKITIRIK